MVTPFVMTATFKDKTGARTKSEPTSFTDVDLSNCTFQNSGNPFFIMPGDGYLSELSIPVAAPDVCKYIKLFLGGYDSGQKWAILDLISVRNPPHIQQPGVFIKGGTMVQFKETVS